VQEDYIRALETWLDHKDLPEQKEFALAIKDRTPLASVLFNARKKHGATIKSAEFRREWREAESSILKKLL
jgi:hypothetical protein